MKKIYILLCLIFSLTFILPIFTGCSGGPNETDGPSFIFDGHTGGVEQLYTVKRHEGMKVPEFSTKLVKEHHIRNIYQRAEKTYGNQRIYVDLLYNYNDEPQFFLVEYGPKADIGIIIDDEYYIIQKAWGYDYESPYRNGYVNSPLDEDDAYGRKKYFLWDYVFYEENGRYQILQVNWKYRLGTEEDNIIYYYSENDARLKNWWENYVLFATGRKETWYGYAKDVNDLKKLEDFEEDIKDKFRYFYPPCDNTYSDEYHKSIIDNYCKDYFETIKDYYFGYEIEFFRNNANTQRFFVVSYTADKTIDNARDDFYEIGIIIENEYYHFGTYSEKEQKIESIKKDDFVYASYFIYESSNAQTPVEKIYTLFGMHERF